MLRSVLDIPAVYRAWQGPFAGRKMRPVIQHNDVKAARRVLDVGCGPGTNAALFAEVPYTGIDWNAQYIEAARRRFGREFITADVTTYRPDSFGHFDFILVNSLLHHLDDGSAASLLEHLVSLLTPDGHIHILDLVLPDKNGVARTMAKWDRGMYPRPLDRWRELFQQHLETVVFEPFGLGLGRVAIWQMVYFKGVIPQ